MLTLINTSCMDEYCYSSLSQLSGYIVLQDHSEIAPQISAISLLITILVGKFSRISWRSTLQCHSFILIPSSLERLIWHHQSINLSAKRLGQVTNEAANYRLDVRCPRSFSPSPNSLLALSQFVNILVAVLKQVCFKDAKLLGTLFRFEVTLWHNLKYQNEI